MLSLEPDLHGDSPEPGMLESPELLKSGRAVVHVARAPGSRMCRCHRVKEDCPADVGEFGQAADLYWWHIMPLCKVRPEARG